MASPVEGKLEFYCGALGSGKTAFAWERAMIHLRLGGTVVTNVQFYREKLRDWMRRENHLRMEDDRLIYVEDGAEIWRHAQTGDDTLTTMMIVDEAHVEHNARDWSKTSREQLMFNTMARKLTIHLIYITQDINNVDKQFRGMANCIWYCRNMATWRVGPFQWPFNVFVRVPYLCAPGVPPRRMSPEITFAPMSFGYYKSKALVGRAQEAFASLKAANTKPLERIPWSPGMRAREAFRLRVRLEWFASVITCVLITLSLLW